jgi:hypothetical protein
VTDKEINQAIAEHCGYTNVVVLSNGVMSGYHPDHRNTVIPVYTEDLNAMHQAEMVLDSTNGGPGNPNCLRYRYACEIYRLAPNNIQPFRATARQRAEAFLWTVEKWKEAKP